MLYQWLEAQRAMMRSVDAWAALATAPWRALCAGPSADPSADPPAETRSGGPGEGASRVARAAVPGYDWIDRLLHPASAPPPFGIASVRIGGQAVRVGETVVDRTPFCALRRFAREFEAPISERDTAPMQGGRPNEAHAGRTTRPPTAAAQAARGETARPCVLLVAPLAGHHAVMLRETVETLLEDTDVYVTDWANARDVPLAQGRFGLDGYVLTVERFVRSLAKQGVHVLAVCQAAPPALAASALVAAASGPAPLSITLMGGPIDTRLHPTMIDRLAATHDVEWFRHTVIDAVPTEYPGAGRRIYPGHVQHAAIVAAHPHRQWALESRYWTSRMSGSADAAAASLRALDEYCAVLDMDEDYFLDTLRIVFQEQRLARGTWSVGPRRVTPEALATTALCTVEGDRDDIAGTGQTHAAHGICTRVPEAKRLRLTVADCDHYDLFTGPRWRDVVHPALQRFWRENTEPLPRRPHARGLH